MAVPGIQAFFEPLLRAIADGAEHRIRDLEPQIADDLRLSETDRAEVLTSGGTRLDSRVGWGFTYLKKQVLLIATGEQCKSLRRAGP